MWNPAKLRQQILSSNKTASEKAEDLLPEREVNEMSKDEWRELIPGIPEDVKREIGRLKSAGTQLHLLTDSTGFVVVSSALFRQKDTCNSMQGVVSGLSVRLSNT